MVIIIILLNHSLDVEEDDDAGDIIYRGVFLLPSLHGFPDQCFGGLLSAIILIMRHHDVNGLIVRDELPNTVTCQDQELVGLDQIHFGYLGDGVYTDLSSGLITETPTHG